MYRDTCDSATGCCHTDIVPVLMMDVTIALDVSIILLIVMATINLLRITVIALLVDVFIPYPMSKR
jgi:hypothetical protein